MNRIINFIKSTDCRISLHFACFRIVFALCFAVMFVMLFVAVIGVTFGLIMAIFGTAVLLFHADFIISGIAPEIMLFGGLTVLFFSGFLGMAAVKIGFIVSRYYLNTRRHCEILRECDYQEPIISDDGIDDTESELSENNDSTQQEE